MNENHAQVCTSPEWAQHLQEEILTPLTRDIDLGKEMLEIGPGPGAATDWLRHRVARLTAVEVEESAAALLADRYRGTNVEIRTGSAAELAFADDSFDSVGCFTMLHHVPTLALQNKILAEAFRVLRPGGLASTGLHDFHEGDVYNPIEPASVLPRLQMLGFSAITVAVHYDLRFTARKPSPDDDGECGASDGEDQS
jgi:ubiquinone/menaquinone biosynthesis C-methylase UbiE